VVDLFFGASQNSYGNTGTQTISFLRLFHIFSAVSSMDNISMDLSDTGKQTVDPCTI